MWLMMPIMFFTVAYIDTRGFIRLKDKKIKFSYIMLMAVSCILGTTSGYVRVMPSPAEPIKDLVMFIVGK